MDKELLFRSRLPEEDFDLEGVGTIRIRGLSRAEALRLQNAGSIATQEAQMLSWGVVDPVLTVAEVNRWLDASPAGELEALSLRIGELSGMSQGADKSGLPGDGERPGAGV